MSVNTKVNGELVKSAGLYSVTKPIGMADIYSTEEKEVGLWVDNKPLYQKTFLITPTSASFTVDASSLNIEKLIDRQATLSRAVSNPSGTQQKDVQYRTETSAYNGYGVVCELINNTIQVGIEGYTVSEITEIRVTLKYTKTTDTPWSGKFVPQGYGYVSSGDIYSFEERQIGVYADGKPLYQKTIDFGELPNNTTKQVNHNVSNIETVVEIKGVSYVNNLIYGENLPPVTASKAFRTSVRESVVEVSSTDNWTGYNARITFKYTKTTDVAGSGEYVPSGDKAKHYSTEEQVIGTWIDGSTIYETTIYWSSVTGAGNTLQSLNHGIANIGSIIDFDFTFGDTYAFKTIPLTDANWFAMMSAITLTQVQYRLGTQYNGSPLKVTIRYTKASS